MSSAITRNSQTEAETLRKSSDGCFTGWLCDADVAKSIMRKSAPDAYLESYPRNRATSLNTWLFRFYLYSNGMFFELDRYGSVLAKDLIKYSNNSRGYLVRIDGTRCGDKIRVTSVSEITKESALHDPDFVRYSQQQLRGEFARMNI
ncbi:MAG TPA: hypothetical protein V6C97_35600 [Oculatellaceae cyanobacterium]